jgi:Leucine-rich repeat (LRR) protein
VHNLPRETLREIVARHGRQVLADPPRCRALLMDYCAEYRGEINVLDMALRENVVRDLLEASPGLPQALVVARLAQRLQDAYYLPADAARWAVESCVAALDGSVPESGSRVFSSRLPCTVLVRGWLESEKQWLRIGATPGEVSIPPDVAVGIRAREGLGPDGALLDDLGRFGPVQYLDCSDTAIADPEVQRFAGLQGLLGVDLSRTGVGDAGLAALAAHPQMRVLKLWDCNAITDHGLEVLEALPWLERLELGQCSRVSNPAASSIGTLSHLLDLGLSATHFGDIGVRRLAGLGTLRHLDLSGTPLSGSGLAGVRQMQELSILNLQGCVRLRPESLAVLRDVVQLTDLDLGGCGLLTDAALLHLRSLQGLTRLSLERLEIGDVGVLYLAELIGLSRLDVSWTRLGDAGLARLCALKGMRELLLSGTRITDVGLARLAQLPGLSELSLSSTAVTDVGLRALVAVPSLEVLDLENTGVHDAGLVHLGELPKLQRLHLNNTVVTDLGLDLLRRLTTVREVDLTQCTRVSDDGIRSLREAGISVIQ